MSKKVEFTLPFKINKSENLEGIKGYTENADNALIITLKIDECGKRYYKIIR